MDWAGVQDLVRLIQSRQTIPKDTLASTKKSLKLPSKSAVCSTLTTLDSIAANCGPPIRSQLAESRWMEMLLSVCCKNPTAAMPICQLFSNWACSYNRELLGRSANAAIQHLRQRSAIIPPPAPLAHHMVRVHFCPLWQLNSSDCDKLWWLQAEVAQQGTPMLGFQRGFDFTSVDLWSPSADSSGQNLHRCKGKLCKLAVLCASEQHLLAVQDPWGLIKATALLVNSAHHPPARHRYTNCSLQVCFCRHCLVEQ